MVEEREARGTWRPWTPEEDALLLQDSPLSRKEIAFQLGRTVAAVTSRARVLRLQDKNGAAAPTEGAVEPEDEEGRPVTLESAIAGMNKNADKLQELAAELREIRRKYDELVDLFEIAQVFIDKLQGRLANQKGRTYLCEAAEAFVESVEVLTL